MGFVQLIHGDCLEIMPTLPEKSVHLVFCDLPYSVNQRQATANSWDMPFDLQRLWSCIRTVRAADAACVFTCKAHLLAGLLLSNYKEFRYDLIWDKVRPSRHLHAKRMPLLRHEQIAVFSKETCRYYPKMTLREKPKRLGRTGVMTKNARTPNYASLDPNHTYTHRYPTTIFSVSRENKTVHPTQKPVALLELIIQTYAQDGDTILDPVAGSGTSAIAAMRTGRNAVCIEKDKGYYDIMCKRVEEERVRLGVKESVQVIYEGQHG